MSTLPTAKSWLQRVNGQMVSLNENLSFGRAASNHVVLADEKVSRHHAMILTQKHDEFWVVDLGSHNGTYVNDRRVHQPVCLKQGDCLRIGMSVFIFRRGTEPDRGHTVGLNITQTIVDCRLAQCWLLVADIVGSTQLARNKSPEENRALTRRWLRQCRQLIEASGGMINKYLGDGFLAFWMAAEVSPKGMASFIEDMLRIEQTTQLHFRIALHYGQTIFGGLVSMGEESLSGPELNFVFRMEKLAGSLGVPCLLSEGANAQLHPHLQTFAKGSHALAGFDREFAFFSFREMGSA